MSVAHRGASGYAPENTVVAVEAAIRMAADLVEVDVQRTKDGHLVVMHDTVLTRTTNAKSVFPDREPWRLREFTLAEIRQLDAAARFSGDKPGEFAGVDLPDDFTGVQTPMLPEVLETLVEGGTSLLLEVKAPKLYPGIGEQVVKQLRSGSAWPGGGRRLVVSSFDWEFIEGFRSLMPEAKLGLIGAPELDRLPHLAAFADLIQPEWGSFDADYVQHAHQAGLQVYAWTLDDPDDIRDAVHIGVDGVVTNKPDVLHEVLRSLPTEVPKATL